MHAHEFVIFLSLSLSEEQNEEILKLGAQEARMRSTQRR